MINAESREKYFIIPYIKSVAEKFFGTAKRLDYKLSFTVAKDLKCFIKNHKDYFKKFSHSSVVYKISCMDCEASYVGQTKRKLSTRINERKNDIKRSSLPSVISRHRLEENHQFDWRGVEIVDRDLILKG